MDTSFTAMAGVRRVGFVQLVKFNTFDGSFEGVMASSAPDQANEILDWQTSRPYIQKWIDECRKRSGGKSLGNIREMHQPNAVGKLTRVQFDDQNEQIHVSGRIVDPLTQKKMAEGVLTGLSVGGDYRKRWADPAKPGFTRYTARVHELSVVDNPCNLDAQLTLVGQDGSQKMVKFASGSSDVVADADDPDLDYEITTVSTRLTKDAGERPDSADSYAYAPGDNKSDWKYPIHDKAHVSAALQRWGQDKGIPDGPRRKAWGRILRAADRHGIHVSDRTYKAEGTSMSAIDSVAEAELRKQQERARQKFEAAAAAAELTRKFRKKMKKLLPVFMTKTYTDSVSGNLVNLEGSIRSLQSAFTPSVAAGMPQTSSKLNPDETIAGATGAMVEDTRSGSDEGEMIEGEGSKFVSGKKPVTMKKLKKILAEERAAGQREMVALFSELFRKPTAEEERKYTGGDGTAVVKTGGGAGVVGEIRATGGAPVRAAIDATKTDTAAAAAASAVGAPSQLEINALHKAASDLSDPAAAAAARARLDAMAGDAIRAAAADGHEPDAVQPVGMRKARTA